MKVVEEEVTEIDKNAETVSIPSYAKYIGKNACFKGKLSRLDLINSNIVIIKGESFEFCANLIFVSFPQSLEKIGGGAFSNCENLEHITFPNDSNLKELGICSFHSCHKLNEFDFPSRVKSINTFSFDYCYSMKKIDLRNTRAKNVKRVSTIGWEELTIYFPATISVESIFENHHAHVIVDSNHPILRTNEKGNIYSYKSFLRGNKSLKRIFIRRGLERISDFCFYHSSLTSVTIPASITIISSYAFQLCEHLRSINFSKNSHLEIIKKAAFNSCSSLKVMKFPKSLRVIEKRAFCICTSLEQIMFPQDSRLEAIKDSFSHTRVKRFSIPPSVRGLTNFVGCMSDLKSVHINNDLFESNEEETAIYSKDGSELICVIPSLHEFTIPNTVRVIKENAFQNSEILTVGEEFTIPASVEIIEDNAFDNCEYLLTIEVESGSKLKSIGSNSLPPFLWNFEIDNEHFKTMEDETVIDLESQETIFWPSSYYQH